MSKTKAPTVADVAADLTKLHTGQVHAEASNLLEEAGYKVRVRSIDGVGQVGIMNFDTSRANLWLVDGKVTNITIG
jgi:hypothetical protein